MEIQLYLPFYVRTKFFGSLVFFAFGVFDFKRRGVKQGCGDDMGGGLVVPRSHVSFWASIPDSQGFFVITHEVFLLEI